MHSILRYTCCVWCYSCKRRIKRRLCSSFSSPFVRFVCLTICFPSASDTHVLLDRDSISFRQPPYTNTKVEGRKYRFPESLLIVIPCPIEMRSCFCLHSTSVADRYCRENYICREKIGISLFFFCFIVGKRLYLSILLGGGGSVYVIHSSNS